MESAAAVGAASEHKWERAYPEGIDWRADIPQYPLGEMFDRAVADYPDRYACEFLGKRLTYGQMGSLVARAAKGLQAMGVTKGSHVGLFLPNTPYSIIFYFAILKCGGVVVNFNPLYADAEIRKMIGEADVEFMVTLDLAILYEKLVPMLEETGLKRIVMCRMAGMLPFPKSLLFPYVRAKELARVPRDGRHVWFDRLIDNDGVLAPVDIGTGDLAVLQFTGGTTGIPKAAMLTHGNLSANVEQCALWFLGAKRGEESILGVLPLFHVFAMTVVMNLGIRFAAEIVLLPRFDLQTTIKTIHKQRPTLFPAVPTIYTAINNFPDLDKYDISSLRMCFSGGAPLPIEVKQTFEARTGCKLVEGYGLSETSPVASANPLFGLNKMGSIGVPMPGTVTELISLEDRKTPVPLGERGEVCLSGPQVMSGYWKRDKESAETLRDGRLHTGDVGYMDEDGYTYIVDRIKDLILAGGYNVYPRNVEEAIYQHPDVAECVVAGVTDAYRGQTVKAYITLQPGKSMDLEDLSAFLQDKLSPIEIPKLLEIREELPKTIIGKLNRKALVDEENARTEDKAAAAG